MKKLLPFLVLFPIFGFNQTVKKTIDHTVYDNWKSIKETKISEDGEIVTYQISPHKGDALFYIQKTSTNQILDTVWRAGNASIHYKNEYICYTISASYDSIRQLKLDKVKKDKYPKDTLAIFLTQKDSNIIIPKIESFKTSKEGDWMAYLLPEDTRPDCPEKKKRKRKKKDECTKDETTGKTLVLYNPITNQKAEIHQVKDYHFNKNGSKIAYVSSLKGKSDSLSVYVIDIAQFTDNSEHFEFNNYITKISSKKLSVKGLTFDDQGNQLAFLQSNDTNKIKTYELVYWHQNSKNTTIIIDSLTENMPENWTVSEYKTPYFSRDGKKLYFGTNQIVEQEPEDTLLASEKAKVDVWSWTDKKLQPMQLKQLRMEKRRTYLAVYHISSQKMIQLANEDLPTIRLNDHNNSDIALGVDNEKYQLEQSWAFPWHSDYYKVDLLTGQSRLIKSKVAYGGSLSPSGQYFVWYNNADSNWYAKDLNTNIEHNLTQSITDNLTSDNNGSPYNAYPEGLVGWVNDNGQENAIINSEFDIWQVDLSNQSTPVCLTAQKGKIDKIKFRLNNLERDSTYITINNNLIHAVNTINKDEYYVKPSNLDIKFLETNHTFNYLIKAKKSDKLFFRMMNFQDYPELYATSLNFETPKKLSNTNPQQADYNWGTVELVHWESYKGLKLDGLLYKPENFDSTKSYPMIVYFYEKYADDIHRHYVPKPTASIIYPTEYISNGYIVFIPDVLYTPGHPAKSAYDCILSGTDYLTQKYSWIDTTKMALQGQSWGGYQTAQLVTMTNKYACGMAGAPVSNMFSAYGGVRWGSGMSRAFQYEHTQSRIGCTIWDCPELYIENSPIFGLPNINTPLLIMHNDGDGAVPWYQGIEMYMGMRRLGKPVWMLNYNGDQHNLMQNANREDLSIRMRQFFDYYLLDAPMPNWMKNGVEAIDKGKKTDLQLSE